MGVSEGDVTQLCPDRRGSYPVINSDSMSSASPIAVRSGLVVTLTLSWLRFVMHKHSKFQRQRRRDSHDRISDRQYRSWEEHCVALGLRTVPGCRSAVQSDENVHAHLWSSQTRASPPDGQAFVQPQANASDRTEPSTLDGTASVDLHRWCCQKHQHV
ncbi:hypothetical protein PDE_00312 [Penicillium oxalicum 114-2]|uniref:Uncharacterized protein n=1 Tax=Penicillium oxalicum (strain 114-2 / CGMCC 5302) TaxID=933388 RepID=S7Z5J9_PENO1|nr:hypothetical protein PDE_00312 [Penicillium oxalicum 114-2]